MTPSRRQSTTLHLILRESAFALAVLALWLLSLLAPLHQSSNLLRELAQAGVNTGGAWTLCIASDLASDPDGTVQLCPAQSIGKADPLAAPPQRAAAMISTLPGESLTFAPRHAPRALAPPQAWQARAPPVLI